jgi:transposase
VKDWLTANAKRIEVFYLPPYSPELNPSEYFNGDLNRTLPHQ